MKKERKLSSFMKFTIAVSLFGSFTSLLIMFYPPSNTVDFSWRKPLIGSFFTIICIIGSIAAISPGKCSKTFDTHLTENRPDTDIKGGFLVKSKGHHPDCGRFSAHMARYRGVSYCAACTGLLAGAVMALATAVLYFFFGFNFIEVSLPAVVVGQLGIVLGFIQWRFKGWVRSAANALFVFGSSLILIEIDQHVSNLYVDLYLIGLVMFWILTRIMISQWDHSRICLACGFSCKTERKVGTLVSSTQSV
jgi:hypothetical protein